jgi:hypothetical protein
MQYRDIEIRILRMAAPGGWKWTVAINGKEKSGICPEHEDATRLAKRFVDSRLGHP